MDYLNNAVPSSPTLPFLDPNEDSTVIYASIENVTQEELDEDVADQQVIIGNAMSTFDQMKEIIKKESEGALAKKTVTDYQRYVKNLRYYLRTQLTLVCTVYGDNF